MNYEEKGEDFEEADLESKTLNQVREALKRMDAGTFGRCLVDGRPISEKRLNATPRTPYCLEHEQKLEARRERQRSKVEELVPTHPLYPPRAQLETAKLYLCG